MGKRIRRKKAKWSRRLLPQVGMIIAAIFLLTIVASTVIQIKGSMKKPEIVTLQGDNQA